jgi:hypothetical protein
VEVAVVADYVGEPEFNHGWLNPGLLALHLRDAVAVFDGSSGSFREVGRIAVPPPGQRLDSASGPWPTLAWDAPGGRLIAGSFDPELQTEFAVISVSDNGRTLAMEHSIDVCRGIDVEPGRPGFDGLPAAVFTGNGVLAPPGVEPTPTATSRPSVPDPTPVLPPLPTDPPPAACVCPHVTRWVPSVAVAVALANPDRVLGWMEPRNPSLPPGPHNPLRTCLSLRNRSAAIYHPTFNPLVFTAGCG